MKNRFARYAFIALLAVAPALAPAPAHAVQPYNPAAFAAAQKDGKSVLVDVYASWCPVCTRQKPIIESIEKENPNLVVFEVDYDADKSALSQFNARQQSTLIVFKGSDEVARSVGSTNSDDIRALVKKAI